MPLSTKASRVVDDRATTVNARARTHKTSFQLPSGPTQSNTGPIGTISCQRARSTSDVCTRGNPGMITTLRAQSHFHWLCVQLPGTLPGIPAQSSFHVRSTYAALDLFCVKGDGYDEGVERTRAHISGTHESTLRAANTIADPAEKRR